MQILKTCFFLLLAVFTLYPCHAGNLLKNSDFSDLTGAKLPRYWTFRGTPLPEIRAKGLLTLGGNAASWMAAIQYVSLKPGSNYTMSWSAAGKAPYSCYIEYTHNVNGRKKIGGLHYKQIKSSEQGSSESFRFTLPADAVQPYLVFHVKSAEEVTFSNLLLRETAETADPAELLKNNRFSMLPGKSLPAGWMCRGPADNFHFADGKAEIKGEKTVLIAPLTGLIGKDAVFTSHIEGQGKFRIYAEWYWTENGRKRSKSTPVKWQEASAKGAKFTLPFKIPKGMAKTASLVIQVDSKGFISFSELSIKEAVHGRFAVSPKAVHKIALPDLVSGQKYQIAYSVRGTGYTGSTTVFHFFQLQLVNRSGKVISILPNEDCMEDFQDKTIAFTATAEKNVYLKIRSLTAGVLEFQNFAVKPAAIQAAADRLVITSPRFRDTFYASVKETEVKGLVISGEAVSGGEAVLKTASGKHYAAPLRKSGTVWQFDLPGEDGQLEVTLKTPKVKEKILKRTIRRLPAAPVEVITGPGRKLYFNGRPFIPIDISRISMPMNEQAGQGGTCITVKAPKVPAECLKILDQGLENNLKIILDISVNVPRTADETKLRLWQHHTDTVLTKEVLSHPALLGYFLSDEPYWNGISMKSLKYAYEFLCKRDPYRPVWIVSAPRGTVEEQRAYAEYCDVFGVDIYPVPAPNDHSHLEDKSLSCVGKYVRRTAEITDGNRPVSIWLQGFAWGDLRNGQRKIYPTWTESRFMVFDSVINGADSFFWFGVWLISDVDFYDDLMKVNRELHSLTGVISSENSVPGEVSDSAVEYRCFHGKAWSCTIAANTQNKKVKVRFSGVSGIPAEPQSFSPYEVKIYPQGNLPPPLAPLPPCGPKELAFRKKLVLKRNSSSYTAPPNMEWIWGEKEKAVPRSRIFARVKFQVSAGLKNASLRLTADDFVEGIFLNGKKIDDGRRIMKDFRYLTSLNIEPVIKTGEHILCIEARDSGMLPCGLLAELRLEYTDGTVVSIPTNSSWETSPHSSGPWDRASTVKKIGELPWGMPRLLNADPFKEPMRSNKNINTEKAETGGQK